MIVRDISGTLFPYSQRILHDCTKNIRAFAEHVCYSGLPEIMLETTGVYPSGSPKEDIWLMYWHAAKLDFLSAFLIL
jgi:hypothetical protein